MLWKNPIISAMRADMSLMLKICLDVKSSWYTGGTYRIFNEKHRHQYLSFGHHCYELDYGVSPSTEYSQGRSITGWIWDRLN